MEHCLETLGKDIKCRDSLIKELYLLLSDEPMFQSIFIFGHVSSGKSYILQKLLKYLKYNVSIVNCLEHTNNRSLFEKIIVDLSSVALCKENGYKLDSRIDNFVDFNTQLQLIFDERPDPIVIVLEKSEKLRDMHENVLPVMLRLGELTQINICTILTSDVTFEKYHSKTGLCEPIRIHFPHYNKEELKEILLHHKSPDNYSDDFYKEYLDLFLSIFHRFCRDFNELRYMAKKNYIKYIEPIEANLIAVNDRNGLYKNIFRVFRTNLEVIYLRMSSDDFNQQSKFSREIESTKTLALSFELPLFSKYLLIAAFLASYNPQSEDKRIFMTEGGPRRRRTNKPKKVLDKRHEGPRSFPLNRLLAILCAIYKDKVDLNALLLTQIPSMCQLGLLTLAGDNNINEPKYKCCVNHAFILVISQNIKFEVNKYLYDRQ